MTPTQIETEVAFFATTRTSQRLMAQLIGCTVYKVRKALKALRRPDGQ